MFTCNFCGYESNSADARFCATCGPNGPSATWNQADVDNRENIERFASIVTSLLSAETSVSREQVLELRSRLKISYPVWMKINEHFESYRETQNGGWPIAVYFRYDAENTFALGDTLIDFEIKNLTNTQFFNTAITWDDPETERLDLQASTRKFITPNASASVGAAVVFDRSGQKEINDLTITISDEIGNKRTFRADGFKVNVRNPSVSIQKNVSTTNTISIEGRGVVDAQGFGSQTAKSSDNNADEITRWELIEISPAIDFSVLVDSIIGPRNSVSEVASHTAKNEERQSTVVETIANDEEPQPTRDEIIAALEMIECWSMSSEYEETAPNKPQYTSSLCIKIPNQMPLKEAKITYFVSEGEWAEYDAKCCTISVDDLKLELDFVGGGLVIHTLNPTTFSERIAELESTGEDELELEIATTLTDGAPLVLTCIEHDGLIFLEYAPHNLELTLGSVEGSDYGHIGYAEAPNFDWYIPLMMSNETLDVSSLEQVMENGSQLYPVGGVDRSEDFDLFSCRAIAKVTSEEKKKWEKQVKMQEWIKNQDKVIAERNKQKKRKKWFS